MKTLLALIWLVVSPACLAHAHLVRSTPAKGSIVEASPDSVTLVFSESVDLMTLTLVGPAAGTARELGPVPQHSGVELRVPLPRLAEGEYELRYVAQSSDFHDVKGTLRFRVDAPAKPAPARGSP